MWGENENTIPLYHALQPAAYKILKSSQWALRKLQKETEIFFLSVTLENTEQLWHHTNPLEIQLT